MEESFGGRGVEVLVRIQESVDERVLFRNKLVVPVLSLDVCFLHVFQDVWELETHVIVGFLEHVRIFRVFRVQIFDGLFREMQRLVHGRYTNTERTFYVDIFYTIS